MINLFEASKILRRVYLGMVEESLREAAENSPYADTRKSELLEEVGEDSEKENEDEQKEDI